MKRKLTLVVLTLSVWSAVLAHPPINPSTVNTILAGADADVTTAVNRYYAGKLTRARYLETVSRTLAQEQADLADINFAPVE